MNFHVGTVQMHIRLLAKFELPTQKANKSHFKFSKIRECGVLRIVRLKTSGISSQYTFAEVPVV